MKTLKPCNFRRAPRFMASPGNGGAVRCFADTLRAVYLKSVEKNNVRISHKNGHDTVGHKHTG
jgi:hypothetical protein